MTHDELGQILSTHGLHPRRSGSHWSCRCPAHEDRRPSLSATITTEGRLLLHCHAGCPFVSILDALGLRGAGAGTSRHTPSPARRRISPDVPAPTWPIDGTDELPDMQLGLPAGALANIGCLWSNEYGAIAAPMYGPEGKVIGIRLRTLNGHKWAVKGSRNGLFRSRASANVGPVLCPEGMTDSAALAGLGLDVVGRPNSCGAFDLVTVAVRGREAIVIADNDPAGIRGAYQLAEWLGAKVVIPPPPYRDVREWIGAGADRDEIVWWLRT